MYLSRLNRTASELAVYASSEALPHPTQNSLPVAGQALPDGIGYPQGSMERFQSCFLHLIPPSQALPGARTGYITLTRQCLGARKSRMPRGVRDALDGYCYH